MTQTVFTDTLLYFSLPKIYNRDASPHRFEGADSSPTSGKRKATPLCKNL